MDKKLNNVTVDMHDPDTVEVPGEDASFRLAGVDSDELGTSTGDRAKKVTEQILGTVDNKMSIQKLGRGIFGRVVSQQTIQPEAPKEQSIEDILAGKPKEFEKFGVDLGLVLLDLGLARRMKEFPDGLPPEMQ